MRAHVAAYVITGGALLAGCAAQGPSSDPLAPVSAQQSILSGSIPAAGSTVTGPVDELRLSFSPPARLDEILLRGPSGDMPAMVHAMGEQADYAIPLSDVGPGTYAVDWRATVQGREHHGSFSFSVK